jgi:hypothetical protein
MACFPTLCFFDSASTVLNPAQQETIEVDIMPIGFAGAGTVNMKVRSCKGTGQIEILPLTTVTNTGVDVLVIDDDGGEDYETYYQAALDSAGRTHGTFDRNSTIIEAGDISPFQAIVWFTGQATPVLTAEDRQIISAYLNSGGRLFISGQDIASALCDPASGESDSASAAWFENTFSAAYEDNYDMLVLSGIAGNSISDGCTLSVSGGDGADNQTSPDWIKFIFGATIFAYPVFRYIDLPNEPDMAAFTVSNGTYRVVYFAFGFEAIDNADDRALLMERILNYFEGPSPVDSETGLTARPEDFTLSPNYPNPFNAATAFALYVPGGNTSAVSLKIYNVLGQEVRNLLSGSISPGGHVIHWDGRDDAGRALASGIYFSRLEAGEFGQTRKLILTR